jgi:serine palmitoyltransferase
MPGSSPIATPKRQPSRSILKQPMRNAASYLAALADADAKSRKADNSPESAFSVPSSDVRSDDDTSTGHAIMTDSDDSCDELDRPPNPSSSEHQFTTLHSEFGHCSNESYRRVSAYKPGSAVMPHVDEDPPYYILVTTYMSYLIMILFGHMRDFLGKRFRLNAYRHLMPHNVRSSLVFLLPQFRCFLRPQGICRAQFRL